MISKLITSMLPYMPQSLVWIFSKRYIAGKNLDEAIETIRDLNSQGFMTTIDLLGEFIEDLKEAEENRDSYLNIIEVAEKSNLDTNYSLKPTMFGLLIDEEKCYEYIRSIVAKAAEYNNFVRIDMEDSPCTDMEIKIFRRIKNEFPKNVGLVLQSYLKRTENDIRNMMDLNNEEVPLNFRICKGIYVEPEEISYKEKSVIGEHYLRNLEIMLQNNAYPCIATHNENFIEGALKLIEEYNPPKDRYEFQMLYGVAPNLRKSILDKGHRMRIYIPFGKDWFAYSVRRLKENPNIFWDIVKAFFSKR
ncbi:MAG: proline dehydrogenase [Candidatus Cloacimonadota bacterium]|nr:MAG: proline dehydrogenase [Candidatus Cloacimonadota bacterium]PIE78873.1 MAG: proline dehydrogenase [Candidatus Delongbacteria bacterium]